MSNQLSRSILIGFAQKFANLIRFLCGALRIFAASALKWPLNAETQRLDGGPQRRFIPKLPFCAKVRRHTPRVVTFSADSRVVVFQACVQTNRFSSERKLKCLSWWGKLCHPD